SPDGKTLASGEKKKVFLWDLSAGAGQAKEKLSFKPHKTVAAVDALSWSRDNRVLAVHLPAQLHDGETGALLRALPAGDDPIRHFSFLPSGRLLLIRRAPTSTHQVQLSVLEETGDPEVASVIVDVPPGDFDYHFHVDGSPDGRHVYFGLAQRTVF